MSSVSVVACVYYEEAHIGRLLRSLREQRFPAAEVIVVDDGSKDRTGAVARQAGAHVISVPHGGPAVGRNIGARAARSEVLVFLDGDMECAPEFIERLTAPIRLDGALGTFTRDIHVGNRSNRWASAYAVMRQLRGGRLLPETFPDKWDNFRAIRRDAFLRVGGYDDIGYGEDRTLARKLGAVAIVAPGAVCLLYNPESPGEIFSNGRWIGRGAQIRELDRPLRDHLPHRVVRWLPRDLKEVPFPVALVARGSYHAGVLVGFVEAKLFPPRHWK